MSDVWDQARDDCLKNCFDVLVDALADDDAGPGTVRFWRCCDLCQKAREIAERKPLSTQAKP